MFRSIAFVAATLLIVCVPAAQAIQVVPEATKTQLVWENLFPPPYTACPEIVIALSCVSADLCFVPGGSNGVGFGMFKFDGKTEGNLIKMTEPNMTMMIMTAAMGGTTAAPNGAFGGVGGLILEMSPAIQYLKNTMTPMTWEPALIEQIEFILETQSMRATDNGQHIIFVGSGINGNAVMHSSDAGALFAVISTDKKIPMVKNCTAPLDAAMVDEKTWYLTAGQFPQDRKNNAKGQSFDKHGNRILHQKNSRVSVVEDKNTGKTRYSFSSPFEKFEEEKQEKLANYRCVGYVAMIAKTTDAGETWEIQYQNDNADFSFSQIDCISATHCVAVGSGQTQGAETVIYQTTDGKTWSKVLSIPQGSTEIEFLYTIRFQDAQHVWAAGGVESRTSSAGLLYYSNDGGSTWAKYPYVQPDLVEIMDLSFADGVGFASAMSEFKTATILKYANQPYYGYFEQSHCPLANCSILCEKISFPQGMCLPAKGGSAMAFCTPDGVKQQIYGTTSCIGSYNTTMQPINQCLKAEDGSYFENFCPPTAQHISPDAIHSKGTQYPFRH